MTTGGLQRAAQLTTGTRFSFLDSDDEHSIASIRRIQTREVQITTHAHQVFELDPDAEVVVWV